MVLKGFKKTAVKDKHSRLGIANAITELARGTLMIPLKLAELLYESDIILITQLTLMYQDPRICRYKWHPILNNVLTLTTKVCYNTGYVILRLLASLDVSILHPVSLSACRLQM